MNSDDKAFVWLIGLCVLAGFLFGGDPDVTDAVIQYLMSE